MGLLTRDDFKSIEANLKREKVDLGGDTYIFVREMTSGERDTFEGTVLSFDAKGGIQRETANYRAKFVCMTACDEAGALVFTLDDAKWLGKKNVRLVDKLFFKAKELNNWSIGDAEKNSDPITGDNSSLT